MESEKLRKKNEGVRENVVMEFDISKVENEKKWRDSKVYNPFYHKNSLRKH